MGNYVSCTLVATPGGGHARTIKVLLPGGEVRRIDGPANAADLMLDVQGHFAVNSRSMQAGRQFAPLAADEDLEMGNVYVMVPMKKVNAVVTAADMAVLFLAANKEVRRTSGGKAKILPDISTQASSESKVEVQDDKLVEDASATAAEMGEFKYRMSISRSRRPTLETIAEEGIYYR